MFCYVGKEHDMIGDNYECDGQMEIHEILIDGPKPNAVLGEIKMGGCNHDFVLLRTKRAKYYKCVKCGKRCRYAKRL